MARLSMPARRAAVTRCLTQKVCPVTAAGAGLGRHNRRVHHLPQFRAPHRQPGLPHQRQLPGSRLRAQGGDQALSHPSPLRAMTCCNCNVSSHSRMSCMVNMVNYMRTAAQAAWLGVGSWAARPTLLAHNVLLLPATVELLGFFPGIASLEEGVRSDRNAQQHSSCTMSCPPHGCCLVPAAVHVGVHEGGRAAPGGAQDAAFPPRRPLPAPWRPPAAHRRGARG